MGNMYFGNPGNPPSAYSAVDSPSYGTLSLGSGPFDGLTTGFYAGPTAGTHVAVNLATGSAADMLNLQIAGVSKFRVNGTGVGFYAATPVAKQTVTGSKGANAALASLMTALVALGLVTDTTS